MKKAKQVRFWYATDQDEEYLISADVQPLEPFEAGTSEPPKYEVEFLYAETIEGRSVDYDELKAEWRVIEYHAIEASKVDHLPRFFSYEIKEADECLKRSLIELTDAEYYLYQAEQQYQKCIRWHREASDEAIRLRNITNT